METLSRRSGLPKTWLLQQMGLTREKFPQQTPRLISDNGSQYVSKELQSFLQAVGLIHVRTSVGYPQSNGKIERFHGTLEAECLHKHSVLDLTDVRRQIGRYIVYYNTRRLHSAINYLTPEDRLLGREKERLEERENTLRQAQNNRAREWKKLQRESVGIPDETSEKSLRPLAKPVEFACEKVTAT